MNVILPYDIRWYIVHYIDDIDIRRSYNIYKKIDLNKYKIISNALRKGNNNINGFKRFETQSNVDNLVDRTIDNVNNDLIDTLIKYQDNKVYVELHIFKLKRKPYHDYINPKDIYYKGSYSDTHYWEYIEIDYEII